MTDAISRLGVVVEEKGIQETLRGLDKLIVMMEKAEKKASSPVAFSVDTRQLDKAADRQIALAEKQKAADQSLARAKEKQEAYTTEVRNREAEKRRTIAENEANRQLTVEAKSSAAREQLVSQFEERRKTYTSKINDDIQKISEKSEKELAKIRLDADSKVRVARETSLQRIEEAEKRSASSVSAIHQKEREKRITDNARAEQRMSLEVQKSSAIQQKEREKRITDNARAEQRMSLEVQKSSAAREQLVSQFEERRKTYTSKINDDIQKISEKSEKELAKIRLDADSKVRVARETSLQRIEEAEKRSASSVSAIQQKEREKRITDNARAEQRMSLEAQKSSSKSEQLAERSNAQIMAIRERTAAFAEKMHLREQAAAERNLKAQQQGFVSLADVAGKAQQILAVGFAGYGIAELTLGLIKAADSMTEMNSRLKLVTSSSGELKNVQEELYRVSQASGTSIKNNADIYFGLARSTKSLGTSQADLIKLTDGLGKAAIVSGASTESYKSAMIQLRQALESGVFRGQEFNSVMEQAPRIAQAIAEGLGKTTGELRKMAGEGKLTTDVVIPALLQGLKKVDEEYAQMPRTVSRGWETISNAFLNWIDKANKASGATNDLSSALFGIAQAMDSVSGEALISTMNKLILAGEVVAGVYAGKVVQAFITSSTAAYQGVKADIAKVNSEASTTAAAMRTAEANNVAAKSALDRANVAVAAAEREVVSSNAALMGTTRATAAREALAIATVTQARAADVASKAEAELAITTNAATVAQERQAAAGTASAVAMSKLGTVFSAMGGWITVAIAGLYGLVYIWDKVANAAENAVKWQKEAKAAARSAETRSEAEKEIPMLQTRISGYKKGISSFEEDLKDPSLTPFQRQRIESQKTTMTSKLKDDSSLLTNLESIAKEHTKNLAEKVVSGIEEEASPAKIAEAFSRGAKHLSKSDQYKKTNDEITARETAALNKLEATKGWGGERAMMSPAAQAEYDAAKNKIKTSAEQERKIAREKGQGAAGGAKRPEISAGLDAGLIFSKEQLELITELTSAQEKLLGYVTPETLAQKQKLEVMVEQENVASKVAKIQEQLAKKNLTPQAKKELQEVLTAYTKRKDSISDELIITQLLQREQNNLKKYQEGILKPVQQRNEIEKATLDVAIQTGQISAEEAQRQASLNSLKLIEVEYAGQVAEAERTLNELQEKGYTDAAKNAQTRLSNLTKERDAKLKVAQIKIDGAEQAKSFEAGFGRAWQKYRDEATDSAKLTEKLMGDVLKGIEDALFNMMSGMKVSFSDLFKSVMNDIKRYLAQQMTKEIGDAILGKSSDNKGGLSSLFGGSKSGSGGGILGTLGTIGTVAKSYGGDILSWMGENTGSTALSGWGASLSGAGADAATDAAASIASDLGNSARSASSAAGSMANVASYAMTAFNVFNSIKTGKGWGATVGSMASLIPGIGPIAGVVGSTIGGLIDDAFSGGGGPKQGGNYNAAFTSTGGVVAENMFGGYTPSELDTQMQTNVKDLQKNYTDLVKQLGGVAKDLTINLGGDLDPQGTAGNRVSAQVAIGAVGTGTSDTGQAERALWDASLYSSVSKSVSGDFDAAVKLETSRMLVAALKSSDLPADVAKVLEGIDLTNITQSQIDALLTQATTAADAFKAAEETVKQAAKDLSDILSLFEKWKSVFPNFAKASDEAKKALSDLAGGLEELSSKMSSYYDHFYSSAEKTEMTWKSISDTLSSAGISVIPKTRAEFRELMESLDIGSESGRKMANALLSVESQFADVTESLDDVAKAAEDAAKATKEAAIKAAQDTLEEARRKVQEAYDREADSLRTVIDRLTQFQDQIKKFRDSLYLDNTLSPLSNYDKYQFAKSKLEETQAKALLGDEKALEELEQASRDFLEYSRIYNANNTQYQQDFDAVQAFLNKVQINTKTQIDQAKQQLLTLDKMVEGILTVNNSVMSLASAIAAYQAALAALLAAQGSGPSAPTPTTPSSGTGGSGTGGSGTGGSGSSGVAPLQGYDATYSAIYGAYNEYFSRTPSQSEANAWAQVLGRTATVDQTRYSIYSGAITGDLAYLKSTRQGWIANGYQTLFGRQASQTEKDSWYGQLDYSTTSNKLYDMLAAGATGSDLEYLKQHHPWMVNGSHANGLANVPFDGYLAELHQGERVLTKNENSEYSGSTNGFATDVVSPLLKEIAALRAEVKALKQEVSNQGDADRSQRGVIAEAQIKVMQTQAVEAIRASNSNL